MKKRLFLTILLAVGFTALAPVYAATSCHKIEARGIGQDDGTGKTKGQLFGGGLLQGTLEGAVTPISPPVNGKVSFTEVVTFSTNHGNLVVELAGSINLTTGVFKASGPVKDATGKLAGARGELELSGIVDFSTGHFTESVEGWICVDLAP
jgi:hypothetical protein